MADPVLSDGHKVVGGPGPASDDAVMWQMLTGGKAGNKVSVQREPELGTPSKKLMTGPEMVTLGAAAIQSAKKNKF